MKRKIDAAYIDGNWAPEISYRLLKALALLYPRTWLWSPNLAEISDFLPTSPLELFESGIFLPAGRVSWFKKGGRGTFEQRYLAKLQPIAERAGGVLLNDYRPGYRAGDDLCRTDEGRNLVIESGRAIMPNFSASHSRAVEDVVERQGWPIERGFANAILQDIDAQRQLEYPQPVILPQFAPGYRIHREQSARCRQIRHRGIEIQKFGGFTKPGLSEQEVEKCVKYLANCNELTWKGVCEFVHVYGVRFRKWLRNAREGDHRTLCEIISQEFQRVENSAELVVQTIAGILGGGIGGALGGALGFAVAGWEGACNGALWGASGGATCGAGLAKWLKGTQVIRPDIVEWSTPSVKLTVPRQSQWLFESRAWVHGTWK